jgi:hypothetical protein
MFVQSPTGTPNFFLLRAESREQRESRERAERESRERVELTDVCPKPYGNSKLFLLRAEREERVDGCLARRLAQQSPTQKNFTTKLYGRCLFKIKNTYTPLHTPYTLGFLRTMGMSKASSGSVSLSDVSR